jgi:UDP-N-acetylmuramoylalanine--D-glutamate ligase
MRNINFNTDKFAIIGLGDTGLSIVKYLQYKKANITKIFDTRDNPPNQNLISDSVELYTGILNYADFSDIDILVISPGISIYDPVIVQAIHNNIYVIGDVELFAQEINNWNTKVVAITGSNGKTTVTTLLGHILTSLGYDTMVAGNIGIPVLESYLQYTNNGITPQFIVLELSSFQLETIHQLNLEVATVLNISEDHLDRYNNLLHYAYIKSTIFNNARVQVLNHDDKLVMAMNNKLKPNIKFGLNKLADYYFNLDNQNLYYQETQLLSATQIQLIGVHNYLNILSVFAILDGLKLDIYDDKLTEAICKFSGVEHRMQKIAIRNNITFVEDSKGTNVGATIAGVSGLNAPVNLILGGDGKGQDFQELKPLVMNKCRSVAIIGQDKDKIFAVLKSIPNVEINVCNSLEDAVLFCYNNAIAGDYVVLSPACASWDMFDNYKHRAEVFIDIVKISIT